MTKTLRLLTALFGIIAITAPSLATAATTTTPTNQSFQISPPTSNYAANPGESVRGNIKVTNLTDQPMTLALGKENFVAKGEEGEIELVDNANPLYSLAPWFNLGTAPSINLAPRATQAFSYTIDVPAGAEPGGRYGSITFRTSASKLPSGQSGAVVEQQIAAIVFLRINGQAKEQVDVASFKTDKSFYEYGPVNILTRARNTGNVHEKLTGTITIKNMLGFTVATLPLDEHFVIPGAIRRLENAYPAKGKAGLMFGRYTVHLEASYASGQKVTADTSFTALPYKLVAGVLIILLIVFLVFWRGRKRLRRAFKILAGRE